MEIERRSALSLVVSEVRLIGETHAVHGTRAIRFADIAYVAEGRVWGAEVSVICVGAFGSTVSAIA